ncbi:heavy metal sensor histidine kinase [Trinickia caryophylli]|uniref:Sensor protein n=1 Tax=Trinickia caryophylli TaxID=28094 RepID=A0A1X7H0W3_TRICW|nr:heavy metal sensor histidine kinase [Trinickia caryophylli]PMS10093.1 HAMP domain-containing protein [Trinickia caryophylli]TRX18190.1 heavy metal sensor histidine kinase [Trinickia caryophylli]WQE11020.1 heavy metal sensor histidine kinase [Trinickia caryophylli]SMF76986.1 two-component system, OmpR family, heavy metal sensor histidine kinase CusS [Trinickia caryophylli]GLU35363.1 two-component sensor histidine kinase [Trinickia caryophylli]
MIERLVPRTMRGRLAILFAFSTSVILAVSGALLYETLSRSIAQSLRHEMEATLAAAVSRLATVDSLDELRAQRPASTLLLQGHEDVDLAVYDTSGGLLVGSPNFVASPNVLSVPLVNVPIPVQHRERPIRYLVAKAELGERRTAALRVVVQRNYRGAQAFLHICALSVVLGIVVGTVLAALLAYRIAVFALKPLSQLAARADEISGNRLAHPLPASDMADELRELTQAFNRMLTRLDESFTRLTQFSSDLAHDIRTPLTNLLAQAQVALSQPRSNEQYRAIIESSVEEFQRLSRMVDDMLFLARADARQRKAHFQLVDGEREALRVARYYESIAEDRGIEIRVEGHCTFEGDPLLVQRALGNLLSNAFNHAPAGSAVSIECRRLDECAVLSVSDTGHGIAETHLSRIFDRFYRLDPARQNSASGTGLGLAIVKSIMDEHGGECVVKSIPNVRTTFSLRFPRRERT